MSLASVRCTFARVSAMRSLLGSKHTVSTTQVATLKAVYGDRYPYLKPWPYETRKINAITEWFDASKARLCENSVVITVDGNCASGKNEFAKQLAKNFDLHYIPAVTEGELFRDIENGFDLRNLNPMLPKRSQYYDLTTFYADENPYSGRVGMAQMEYYKKRFLQTCRGLLHLFSTGQGVVLVRSPWSDFVFSEALRHMKYVSKHFRAYYDETVDNSICELLKPHLCIYLDTPINVIMDNIKKRNDPREVGSKVMTEEYVNKIDEIYKTKFIPIMKKTGEVLIVDTSDLETLDDHDVIAEEIQSLTLTPFDCDDPKFSDWFYITEDQTVHYRKVFDVPNMQFTNLLEREYPWDCPEIVYHLDDSDIIERVVALHPALRYDPGYSHELGNTWKTLFSFK